MDETRNRTWTSTTAAIESSRCWNIRPTYSLSTWGTNSILSNHQHLISRSELISLPDSAIAMGSHG